MSRPFDSTLKHLIEFTSQLLKGVRNMKESVTYQAILREGKAEGLAEGLAEGELRGIRRVLLNHGTRRFGRPPARIKAAIDAMTDLERVESPTQRVLEAKSWSDPMNA
jgi:predicted transposase YdaD